MSGAWGVHDWRGLDQAVLLGVFLLACVVGVVVTARAFLRDIDGPSRGRTPRIVRRTRRSR